MFPWTLSCPPGRARPSTDTGVRARSDNPGSRRSPRQTSNGLDRRQLADDDRARRAPQHFIAPGWPLGDVDFYVLDADFGPGFIKICTYFPYPAKVWVNGHEWAKRQADRHGIAYTALANGFASCCEPERLQAICDRFGPTDVQAFFDRWISVIPTPLTEADRVGGYW